MTKPSIQAIRGTNPDTLGLEGEERKDPSGFERHGYTSRDVDALLQIVNAGIQEVVQATPESVLQYAPRTIPIYVDQTRKAWGAEATTLSVEKRGDISVESIAYATPRGPWVRIIRRGMQPHGGISFAATPQEIRDNPQSWRHTAGHEALHVLVGKGIHFSGSTEEGIVCRLDEVIYGTRGSLQDFDWDENAIWASSGTRNPDDFSSATHTKDSKPIPYIAGPLQLRFLATEKLWEVCAKQLEIAHGTGYLPGSAQFAQTVREALPEPDADRVLGSIMFKEVVPGIQQFIFPNKARSQALIYTQEVEMNPDFGYPYGDMINNFSVHWKDSPVHARKFLAHIEQEGPDIGIGGTFDLRPFTRLELEQVEKSILSAKPQDASWKRVRKVQCDVGHRILELVRGTAEKA